MKFHNHELVIDFVKRFGSGKTVYVDKYLYNQGQCLDLGNMVSASLVTRTADSLKPVYTFTPTHAGLIVLSAWKQLERLSEEIDPNGRKNDERPERPF